MIFIEDNFFPEKEYIKICEEILNTNFVPPPKERREGTEKGSGTPGGAYWFEKELTLNEKVIFLCEKLIKDKFNYKIKQFNQAYYTMVTTQKQFAPHIDKLGAYHCLIYILGDQKINNGTGFYVKKNNELVLNTHVGFNPNRAIMFSGDNYHSPLLWAGDSSPRFSLCTFFD